MDSESMNDVVNDSETYILYQKLYGVYKKCHPFEVNGQSVQRNVNNIWKKARKENKNVTDLDRAISHIIHDMEIDFLNSKAGSVRRLFKKVKFYKWRFMSYSNIFKNFCSKIKLYFRPKFFAEKQFQ